MSDLKLEQILNQVVQGAKTDGLEKQAGKASGAVKLWNALKWPLGIGGSAVAINQLTKEDDPKVETPVTLPDNKKEEDGGLPPASEVKKETDLDMSGGYEAPQFTPPVEKPVDDNSGTILSDTTNVNKVPGEKPVEVPPAEVDSLDYYKKQLALEKEKVKKLTEEKPTEAKPTEPKPDKEGDAQKEYDKKVKETQDVDKINKKKTRYDAIDDLLKENSYKGSKASNVFNKLAEGQYEPTPEQIGGWSTPNRYTASREKKKGLIGWAQRILPGGKDGMETVLRDSAGRTPEEFDALPWMERKTHSNELQDKVNKENEEYFKNKKKRKEGDLSRYIKRKRGEKSTAEDKSKPQTTTAPKDSSGAPQNLPANPLKKEGSKAGVLFNKIAQQNKKETDVNDRVDVTYQSPIWKHEAGTPRFDDVIKSMKLDPNAYRYVTADTTRWNAPQAQVPGSGMDMIHWAIPKDEQLDPQLQTEISSKTDSAPKNLNFLGNYYTYNKERAKRDVKQDKKETK